MKEPFYLQVKRRMSLVFLVVYTLPWITHIHHFFLSAVVDGKCRVWYNMNTELQKMFVLAVGMLSMCVIPSVLIIYLYGHMFIAIKFGFSAGSKHENSGKLSKGQMNIFTTCVLMVAASLICWMYFFLVLSIHPNNGDVVNMTNVILLTNSILNPIIYVVR